MIYTKKFLISELQRFVSENSRNPRAIDMQSKFGYPGYDSYIRLFGSWNKALIEARLEVNQVRYKLDGTETCDNCGKNKPENQHWNYKNEQRLCYTCYQTLNNHKNGKLDPNSEVGFAFMSQRVVAETLGLDLKYDCNCSIGFNAPYDLYDEKLGSINVKTRVLKYNKYWNFGLSNKYIPDIYIMLGFSSDKSDILHVWITEPEDDLTFDNKKFKYKQSISITNDINSGLKRAAPWEVDVEPYNDAYHNMSLENCKVLRSD